MFKWRDAVQVFARLLIALAAVVGSALLFRFVLLPELQSAFDLGDTMMSALRRGGMLLFALAGYWGYVRVFEKREVGEICIAPAGMALGLLSGAALISITTLSLFALGVYETTAVRGVQSGLPGVAVVILVAAMLEEIVFRGVLFRILESAWGTVPALWLAALIFAVLHLANIEGAGVAAAITTVISGTLIGAFWTLIFVRWRNLWIVGVHHAAWNFSILLTGLPLSGIEDWRAVAPFDSRYNGPDWLTGGAFGPEDSVITIGVVVLGLVALLYSARRDSRMISVAAG